MNWRNKLNKTELKHLKEHHLVTLQDIKETRDAQKKLDPTREVCWECRGIAEKLGIEEVK